MSTKELSRNERDQLIDHLSDPRGSVNIDLLDLIIILLENKRVLFLASLISGSLALLLALLLPNQYTATTKLFPPQQEKSLTSSMLGELGGLLALGGAGEGFGLRDSSEMYRQMTESRRISDTLIQKFQLKAVYHKKSAQDAREKLADNTQISTDKSGIVKIEVTDRDPVRAANIANAYATEFASLLQSVSTNRSAQRRGFFERELESARGNLAKSENDLKTVEEQTGVVALEPQARVAIEQAARIRAEITVREVGLRGIQTYATENSPEVIKTKEQLEALKGELSKLETEQSRVGLIPFGDVPNKGLEYLRRLREVKYNEAINQVLTKQYEAAKLDEANSVSPVQVLDTAIPPEKKSGPKRTLITLCAMLGGLLLGIAVVVARDLVARMEADPALKSRTALVKELVRIRRFS